MTGLLLDERGRACPLPLIALGRARRDLPPGTIVTLLADDPVVLTDVPAWCAMVGATLLSSRPDGDGDGDGDGDITLVVRLPPSPDAGAGTREAPSAAPGG